MAGPGSLGQSTRACWPWRSRSTNEATMILQPAGLLASLPVLEGTELLGRVGRSSAAAKTDRRSRSLSAAGVWVQLVVSGLAGKFLQHRQQPGTPQHTNFRAIKQPG